MYLRPILILTAIVALFTMALWANFANAAEVEPGTHYPIAQPYVDPYYPDSYNYYDNYYNNDYYYQPRYNYYYEDPVIFPERYLIRESQRPYYYDFYYR